MAQGVLDALRYNPITANPMDLAREVVSRIQGQGAGAPNLGTMADRAATQAGLPQPETAGEQLGVNIGAAGVAGALGGAPMGVGGLLRGGVSGLAQGTGQEAATVMGAPPWLAQMIGAASGILPGAAESALRGTQTPTGEAARRVTDLADQEGVTPTTAVSAEAGMRGGVQTNQTRIRNFVAQTLGVENVDAMQRLNELKAEIKAKGDALYPKAYGPPDAPVTVFVNPRLRVLLENPDVRSALKQTTDFLNSSIDRNSYEPRPPLPQIYDMKGRVVADQIPVEALDRLKQGFDLMAEQQAEGMGIQRVKKGQIAAKLRGIRTMTDEQLKTQGLTDLAKARDAVAKLESQRDALLEGADAFKPTEAADRGDKVPTTRESIQARLKAMTPEEQKAFRIGALTPIVQQVSRGVPPETLTRITALMPDKTSTDAFVRAIAKAKTNRALVNDIGGGTTTSPTDITTGLLEGMSGIQRRGQFHILRGLFEPVLGPEAKQLIAQYLMGDPKAGEALLSAVAQRSGNPAGIPIPALAGAGAAAITSEPDETKRLAQ